MKTKKLMNILLMIVFVSNFSSAQNVGLRLNQLWCDKTTEAGEDEIYFIINYRYSNGTSGQSRVGNHWSLNDGNQPRQINQIWLWQGMLPINTYVDVTVMVMEEDNGGGNKILNDLRKGMNYLAPMACQAFPESCPYAAAIVGVINSAHQIVGIANNGSDDYIGSYTIRITNTNGMLFTFGYGVDRCNYFNQFVNSANNDLRTVQQVRLVGDGSNYQMFTQSTYF